MNITACIITKNESTKILKCINNLSFCDEILIYDTGSDDDTMALATSAGARVIQNKFLEFDFSKYREIASSYAKNDWLLHIDADEVVLEDLKNEIIEAVSSKNHDGYFIGREDFFLGHNITHGELSKAHKVGFVRLYKKGVGSWVGKVHEHFQPFNKSKVGYLKSKIKHFAHDNVSEFIAKINSYSSLRAKECQSKKSYFNFYSILFLPLFKFIHTFFFKKGFIDKEPGFIYSFMMSFHSFLARSKAYVIFDK